MCIFLEKVSVYAYFCVAAKVNRDGIVPMKQKWNFVVIPPFLCLCKLILWIKNSIACSSLKFDKGAQDPKCTNQIFIYLFFSFCKMQWNAISKFVLWVPNWILFPQFFSKLRVFPLSSNFSQLFHNAVLLLNSAATHV